jgi:hypothetical protein
MDLEDKARVEEDLRRASLGQRWSRSAEPPPLVSRLVWGMFCWEVTKKRRGDTTIPRNADADFGFSRVLEEASPAHAIPLFGRLTPAPGKTTGSGVSSGPQCASHNAGRERASNQLSFAARGPGSRRCDLAITPLLSK